MSYQEYAQFGKSAQQRSHDGSRVPPRSRADRPYTGSLSSFSVPRKTPLHSTSSSTSSASLSPSNSASQKAGNRSPTVSHPSDGGNAPTMGHLKQLELELGMEKKPDLMDVVLPWRPFYLQRKILLSFVIVFTGLAVSLEALLGYSTRNMGLHGTSQAGHYLWRFAPTAVLILITALWTRVEYQAKHAAPWLRMSIGPADAERTLLLDYIAMTQPWSIVQAIRNRDFVVAATTVVCMFLKVLVVASTGLMYMGLVDVPSQATLVTLQTSFLNNGSTLADSGNLAFFTMLGLQQEDLAFPEGVSSAFAYQQFSSDVPFDSAVTATVDGLSAGLECEPARLNVSGVQSGQRLQQFNTSFTAGDCTISMPITSASFSQQARNQTLYFTRFGQGTCANSDGGSDRRIVIVFGVDTFNPRPLPTNASTTNIVVNGTIPRSASLLCKPTYSVNRVDVTKKNGLLVGVNPSPENEQRALANVEAWGIADAFFGSFRNELADTYADVTPWFYQPGVVNVDPVMYLALDFRLRSTGVAVAPEALLDGGLLQDVVSDYFGQYIPLLASRSLMQQSSTAATATAVVKGERLMVSSAVTHFIVTHLAGAAVLTVAAILMVPKKGFLPRSPSSIMDTAALIANSRELLQTLRGAGGGDLRMLEERLAGLQFYSGVEAYERADTRGSGYFKIFGSQRPQEAPHSYAEPTDKFPYPSLLHPAQRLLALLVTIGLIIGLDFTLQTSNKNGGFDDVDEAENRHLLWTVVPASVLCLLALYFITSGFMVRLLSPYFALANGSTFEQSIGLDLVDKAPLIVLYRALRSRNLAVGCAAVAAFVSSLFAMFAATLFTAATVPTTASCQLVTQDFFSQSNGAPDLGFCTTCQNGTVLASLVLNGNVSYPGFTFEDLAFPTVSLASVPEDMRDLPDDVIVSATIPGVRPSLVCRSFQQSELVVDLSVSETLAGTGNPMQVILPAAAGGDGAEDNTVVISTGYNLDDLDDPGKPIDPNAFFGAGAYRPVLSGNGTVSRWIWVWGQFQGAGTNQARVRSVSALTCNETIHQLNVAVHFVGGALAISQSDPPIPDEASATLVPVAIDDNLQYNDLVTLDTPHVLDPFFMSLTASRFAVPVSSLGDPSSSSQVADAITFQHGLIRTQIINTWNRRPTSSPDGPSSPVDIAGNRMGNATPIAFPARLTVNSLDSGAARRVVQDMVSTRILQALLAAVLVASAASWLALPRANILPRKAATSIASIAALLADGNIFGMLGRGAEWQPTEDLQRYFRDGLHVTMGFQLGWERIRTRRRRGTRDEVGKSRDGGRSASASASAVEVFGVGVVRTGGWGGGENVGLGLQARVAFSQRGFVRDWGWRT